MWSNSSNGKIELEHKRDVYSVGMIMWEIFTGKELPVHEISNGRTPNVDALSADIQKMLKACWEPDPAKRVSASDVNDFLSDISARVKN